MELTLCGSLGPARRASAGKKIPYNQRDAPWSTYTCKLGFPVMGIWQDDSDRSDINSVCRSSRGAAKLILPPGTDVSVRPEPTTFAQHQPRCWQASAATLRSCRGCGAQKLTPGDMVASVYQPTEDECADGVPTCGYLVSGDDFSTVRLFNYPAVWDDAPYKAFRCARGPGGEPRRVNSSRASHGHGAAVDASPQRWMRHRCGGGLCARRGHASHIMTVRFNADDRYVVSLGGHDRGIFQWRTCGVALEDAEGDRVSSRRVSVGEGASQRVPAACLTAGKCCGVPAQDILAAWRTAIKRRGEKESVLEPNPGVEWVALDEQGKNFGPRAVKEKVQEEEQQLEELRTISKLGGTLTPEMLASLGEPMSPGRLSQFGSGGGALVGGRTLGASTTIKRI